MVRNRIFISYSHKDHEWLERLRVHLKPHFPVSSDITPWDDHQIEEGEKWQEAIEAAVDQACVALLLLSPEFLASEYIITKELPILMTAVHEEGVKLLWIPIRPSAVMDTDIGNYQALSDPQRPLASLDPAARDEQMVSIARTIWRHARPLEREAERRLPEDSLEPIRVFDPSFGEITIGALDRHGQIWVSNGQLLRVFSISDSHSIAGRGLADRSWKQHLPEIWQDGLLLSDWDGTLYRFGSKPSGDDGQLYRARNDDLPIHLLAAGPDDQLLAASWNGLIRRWGADGKPIGEPLMLPYLPLQLIALPEGRLAVSDQANVLRLFDSSGEEIWCWQADEPIANVWPTSEQDRATFVVQLGRWRVARVGPQERDVAERRFDEPIAAACLVSGVSGDDYLVMASDGGKLDWLAIVPFSIIPRDENQGSVFVRQVLGVPCTPDRPSTDPMAIGVTTDGELFVAQPSDVQVYHLPGKISRLLVGPYGRFLFAFSGNHLELYRNPQISGRFQLELEKVTGTLTVDAFKKLKVTLRNTGSITIHRVAVLVEASALADTSANIGSLSRPVPPGEVFHLEFTARAMVAGDAVPLTLVIGVNDEGGPWLSPIKVPLSVVSTARGSGDGD